MSSQNLPRFPAFLALLPSKAIHLMAMGQGRGIWELSEVYWFTEPQQVFTTTGIIGKVGPLQSTLPKKTLQNSFVF